MFRGELYVENMRGQLKRFVRVGGLMLHLCPTRMNSYIPNKMTTNNAGWTRGWFFLRNFGNRLPAFTNKVLRERPAKWDWGYRPQRIKPGSRSSPTHWCTWRGRG